MDILIFIRPEMAQKYMLMPAASVVIASELVFIDGVDGDKLRKRFNQVEIKR